MKAHNNDNNNIPWLQEPSSSLIDSLVACGLVSSKARITHKPKPQSNLKTVTPNTKQIIISNGEPIPKTPSPSKARFSQTPTSPILNNRTTNQIRASTPSYDKRKTFSQIRAQTAKGTRKITPSSPSDINSFTTPAQSEEEVLLTKRGLSFRSENSSTKPPNIDEYMSPNRKYAGKKDAIELATNYHSFLKTVDLDDYSDPEKLSESIQKSIDYTILTFNKLIFQLRGFSEEHAKLLVEIKNFFIQRIQQLPEMSQIYTMKLIEADKKVELMNENELTLKKEINDREMSIKSLQNEINHEKDLYEKQNLLLQKSQEDYNNLILSNAQYEDDKKSLMFKLTKSEEALKKSQQTATANQEMLNNAKAQIKSQENLIEKYQQEGAGFRPLYLKATDENSKLKDQIVELQEKIQGMVYRQQTNDAEVQTDPVIVTPINQPTVGPRKKKDRIRSGSVKKSSINGLDEGVSFPMNPFKNSVDQFQLTRENRESRKSINLKSKGDLPPIGPSAAPQPPLPPQPNQQQSDQSVNNNNNNPSSKPDSTTISGNSSNLELKQVENVPNSTTKEKNEVEKPAKEVKRLNALSKDLPSVSTSQIPNFPSLQRLQSDIPGRVVDKVTGSDSSIPLPSDYKIDNKNIESTPTLVNCVYRLLPLRLDMTLSNSPSLRINTIIAKGKSQPKEFYWVLHRIVDFFHSMYSIDKANSAEEDTVTLFRNNLIESCEMEILADKIFSDIVQSCQFYKLTNSCVRFFLRFLMQELTIVDFKFFNIVFNLCFEYIYPPIVEIIDDQDLLPEQPLFLIHVDICKAVVALVFPYNTSGLNYNQLRKETKATVHVDLVDFFAFATKMIILFRETHQQFHSQVKNILTLVGWSQAIEVSEPLFKDFFVLVEPLSDKQDIEKLWQRFKLEASLSEEEVTINQASFIHFCSDFPDVSNKLLALPYLPNFDHVFSQQPGPLQELLTFIKKRFTKFVRDVLLMLPKDLKTMSEKIVLKIRNSLLRCDISTALISYRHFLQLIDLKLTELSPFIVFSQETCVNDVNVILSMLHSRESLTIISLGCGNKIEHELTTISEKPPENKTNDSNGLEHLLDQEEENSDEKENKNS